MNKIILKGADDKRDKINALSWFIAGGYVGDPEGIIQDGLREDLNQDEIGEAEKMAEEWMARRAKKSSCPF